MIQNRDGFVREVYFNAIVQEGSPCSECDRCFTQYHFSRLRDFPHKPCFPPIGGSNLEQPLFIGTNPRCHVGTKDEDFCRHALSSETSFLKFSRDGMYIDSNGHSKWLFDDPHYDIHKECLARVNPLWRLGKNGGVAELFMCSSKDADIFYKGHNLYQKYDLEEYICAEISDKIH